jgi:hypothetical protein
MEVVCGYIYCVKSSLGPRIMKNQLFNVLTTVASYANFME